MSMLLVLNCLALLSLIVLEGCIFRAAFHETARLAGLVNQSDATRHGQIRRQIPDFVAQLLDGPGIASSELRGRRSALLFVSRVTIPRIAPAVFDSMVHGIWHSGNEALSVVCTASPDECRRFSRAYLARYEASARVIVDTDGEVAQAFSVDCAVPFAIVVDADGQILKTGTLSPPEFQDHAHAGP